MRNYLQRLQLDISGLSVIHVTGTKGKGSTCALAESVLRHHGFKTGLFTSPHLLEVTERVRVSGRPLSKEVFARYFYDVWDRLKATLADAEEARQAADVADMPGYFHLLTLVGLWCFVHEQVDVCVMEVGMGGRFDATNVVPAPAACGVTVLDLDHTQILGDTVDKIAWEKGGIFKSGSPAFAVQQPRGGMSVLLQCSREARCELEVVDALPRLDAGGAPYEIGLAGDHQRVNAGLALRLCASWIEARQRIQTPNLSLSSAAHATGTDVVAHSEMATSAGSVGVDDKYRCLDAQAVHRGLSKCTWPGRCQVFRPPNLPSVTIYLDGAHTEQSMRACLKWFVEQTTKQTSTTGIDLRSTSDLHTESGGASTAESSQSHRRVLCFYSSHERDVVTQLDMLASADGVSVPTKSTDDPPAFVTGHEGKTPLFDEAWFMEIAAKRPSRFTPPTARQLLEAHGIPITSIDPALTAVLAPRSTEQLPMTWQRSLEKVWISLQTQGGRRLSVTRIVTPQTLLEHLARREADESGRENALDHGKPDLLPPGSGKRQEANARVDVLCTGSLYAVAAALEVFGAEVV